MIMRWVNWRLGMIIEATIRMRSWKTCMIMEMEEERGAVRGA